MSNDRKYERVEEAAVARMRDDMKKYMLAVVSADSKENNPETHASHTESEQDAILARRKGVDKARALQHKECMAIASYGEHAQKKCHARMIEKTPQPPGAASAVGDGVAPAPGPSSAVGDTTPSVLCYQCSFDTTTQLVREPRHVSSIEALHCAF